MFLFFQQQSESKVVLAQLEVSNLRNEIDRRLHEKDEEFENTKRNHQRAIESMQASLEAELKAKSELYKHKKKLETDVSELEVQLDYLNRQLVEQQRNHKKLSQTIADYQAQIEDEVRQKTEYQEAYNCSERRINSLVAELEETRLGQGQVERAFKNAENELHDAANQISQMMVNNESLNSIKRKLECDLATLTGDFDDAGVEIKVNSFIKSGVN